MMGKERFIALPVTTDSAAARASGRWAGRAKTLAAIGLSLLLLSLTDVGSTVTDWLDKLDRDDGKPYISTSCHQAEPLLPKTFDPASAVQGQEGRIRDWLSGAVKVPTEMFDVMGPIGEDARWDIFYNFSDCTSQIRSVDLLGTGHPLG